MTDPPPPTEHQLTILAAYFEAGSAKAAATSLGLSPQTVKNALGDIYRKLDVCGSIEAAVKLGWIKIPMNYGLCGWIGVCTRSKDHRGHHGGFRGYHQARHSSTEVTNGWIAQR